MLHLTQFCWCFFSVFFFQIPHYISPFYSRDSHSYYIVYFNGPIKVSNAAYDTEVKIISFSSVEKRPSASDTAFHVFLQEKNIYTMFYFDIQIKYSMFEIAAKNSKNNWKTVLLLSVLSVWINIDSVTWFVIFLRVCLCIAFKVLKDRAGGFALIYTSFCR